MYVSVNGGGQRTRLKANLPTVAVQDLTVHPRENDLVIATYGRAVWAGDITPLQELSAEVLAKRFHLFAVEPKARYNFSVQGMNYHLFGDKYLEVPNEPEALVVQCALQSDASGQAQVTLADAAGRTVRQVTGPARAGLNRVLISLAGGGGGRGGGRAGGPPGDRSRWATTRSPPRSVVIDRRCPHACASVACGGRAWAQPVYSRSASTGSPRDPRLAGAGGEAEVLDAF